MNDERDLIIIGGGPAGYTAALYAARANLRPLVIEGFNWGGQLMITSDVENYPGYADGIMGPEMMADFRRQAERFETEFVTDNVTRVDFSERPFRIWVEDDGVHARASVIVATGASARWLGLESEERLKGRGVSACATCDGAFFRDKHIFVVGGGDSAFEEALFLTRFGYKVTLVHRRDEFRASPIMVDRARAHEKIEFKTPFEVEEVLGENSISGLRLRNTETGETEEVEAGALFVAIGHDPNTALFVDQLDHDENGYLVTKPGSTETNIPGVFAVGDVQDHIYRQAVTAAGSGCMGALDAERFLAGGGHARRATRRAEAEPTRSSRARGESARGDGRDAGSTCSTRRSRSCGRRRRSDLEPTALERLLAPPEHEDEPRPTLQGHGDYVFGVFLIAVVVPRGRRRLLPGDRHRRSRTRRSSPSARRRRTACLRATSTTVKKAAKPDDPPGCSRTGSIDEIAERYLDLVDALDDEIDELEDRVETQPAGQTRARIGALRHDLLHIRRTLTRCATPCAA